MHVHKGELLVWVDLKQLAQEEIEVLALNDGFANFKQFYNWFAQLVKASACKCWKGRLIHWNNIIRY